MRLRFVKVETHNETITILLSVKLSKLVKSTLSNMNTIPCILTTTIT